MTWTVKLAERDAIHDLTRTGIHVSGCSASSALDEAREAAHMHGYIPSVITGWEPQGKGSRYTALVCG